MTFEDRRTGDWGVPMRNRLVFSKMALVVVMAFVIAILTRNLALGESGIWTEKAPLPTSRTELAIGVVNETLYSVGGSVLYVGVGGSWEYLPNVEAYNATTNSWITKAPMPTPRGRVAVGVVDGILYVLGGLTSPTKATPTRMDAYDPAKDKWMERAPMPTPRGGYGVGVVKRTLYAVGGWGAIGPTDLVEAYDPALNRWTAVAPMPSSRTNLAVGVVGGILYAVGGVCCDPGPGNRVYDTVEAYDPVSNTWTTKARMPTQRNAPIVGVAGQILYVAGGYGGPEGNVPANTMDAYDPIKNAWTRKSPLPGDRNFLALAGVKGTLYAIGAVSRFPEGLPHSPTRVEVDARLYAFKGLP